jgi:hypothetical protein
MKTALVLACLFTLCRAAPPVSSTSADLKRELASLSLDPNASYRVRDLRLTRGDVSIFFNEGVLMFAHPVAGHRVAAVFTTTDTEAGDGEVLLLPAQASERASLAAFTGSANLDEHFKVAILFFADNTLDEVNAHLAKSPLQLAPDAESKVAEPVNHILQNQKGPVNIAMLEALLDAHEPTNGPFFATVIGDNLGVFNIVYDPDSFEPVTIGRTEEDKKGKASFRVWTGYRPRQAPAYTAPKTAIHDYRMDVTIDPDLKLNAIARFQYVASAKDGRTIALNLSPRLRTESVTVNGIAAEFAQPPSQGDTGPFETDAAMLLVTTEPLTGGATYDVEVHYSGSVIRRISKDSYFVGDRAIWYPRSSPMLTNFDLVFHYPEQFHLVSTGELVEDEKVTAHVRTVHRRTTVPEQFAGFNLGEYTRLQLDSGSYHIDCYADSTASSGMNGIPAESAGILSDYTKLWGPLPIRSLSVTPIPGYFGQGFPGLIYLSNIAYEKEQDRPAELRNPGSDMFFSGLLLPHEIAHQWWGNMVTAANYRSWWLMEAMANYSALEIVRERDGARIAADVLKTFRERLLQLQDGKPVESFGPLDFGERLLDNNGEFVWHVIVYEKGAWVLHMLRERMGADQFRALQRYILEHYNGRGITNDQFREEAARFLPPGDPDPALKKFFETWVYGTGIPKLRIVHAGKSKTKDFTVMVSGVDDEFTADLPLRCKSADGRERTRWIAIVSGENTPTHMSPTDSCELPGETEFLTQP